MLRTAVRGPDMVSIGTPEGLLIIAGGNGTPIQEPAGGYAFYRDEVGVVERDSPGPWRSAPSLGAGNGRRAAPGLFTSGHAYLADGVVKGEPLTDTILATRIVGTPSTFEPWQPAGALPIGPGT